jgi:hypothetical protein
MIVTGVSYHKLPQFTRCRCKLFQTASELCGLSQAIQGCFNLPQNFVKLPLVITDRLKLFAAVLCCFKLSEAP